jgi:hypothetical protein
MSSSINKLSNAFDISKTVTMKQCEQCELERFHLFHCFSASKRSETLSLERGLSLQSRVLHLPLKFPASHEM